MMPTSFITVAQCDRRVDGEAGLTLLEVALVLTVSMAVMAALMPTLSATVRDARNARALLDTQNIVTAMSAMAGDRLSSNFTFDGSTLAASKVSLLVSDGDMPSACTAATGCDGGAQSWNRLVGSSAPILVDFLERHLVTNNPGGNSANDYPVLGILGIWKGAYLNAPIDSDPWGNRYMVNTHHEGSVLSNVIVLSAGPNETTECIFTNPAYTLPSCGGDDIATLQQI